MSYQASSDEYTLGHSESEVQRLVTQSDLYRPLTERIFREAGIIPGMRVLDVGCGAGDVSFLAAEMVGSEGSVLGVDRAAPAVDKARQRAREQGISNVSFVCSALNALDIPDLFDAAVGRLILCHTADPVLAVRQAAKQVRRDGLVIFHEADWSLRFGDGTWPVLPLFKACGSWITETMIRCGIDIDIGKKLHQIFKAAGLPAPEMRLERGIGSQRPSVKAAFVAQTVRTLSPKIEEFGLATASEIQIETLATRLEAELVAADAITIGIPMVGAWSHRP